ncbi:MAG: lamin tail domain-containing protein [Myxococcota bacterium]|nr:lamin tail domain-containing protein [Myxococcota bacterium]
MATKQRLAITLSLILSCQVGCNSDTPTDGQTIGTSGGQIYRDPMTRNMMMGGNAGIILPMPTDTPESRPGAGGQAGSLSESAGGQITASTDSSTTGGTPRAMTPMAGRADDGGTQATRGGEPDASGQPSSAGIPTRPARTPRPGDLIVTEIMFDTNIIGLEDWVEIYNRSDVRLDLNGCIFTELDNGMPRGLPKAADLSGIQVDSGAFVLLLRRDDQVAEPMVADLSVDGTFDFGLKDNETIRIVCGADTIDEVIYTVPDAAAPATRFSTSTGRSLSRSGADIAVGADGPDVRWCAGLESYTDDAVNGPFGTPGLANPACDEPNGMGGAPAEVEQPPVGGQALETRELNIVESPENGPADGRAVINELLINSVGNDGLTKEEWVELHNPSESPIRLDGCTLGDDDGIRDQMPVRLDGLSIPPRGFIVLGQSANMDENGGIDVVRVIDFVMKNGGEVVQLICDGVIAHQVELPNTGDGRAAQRDTTGGMVRWCEAGNQYNPAIDNFGTPGAANGRCASD